MDVIARVSQFGNLLRKKLDAVHGVAENNALVDFQLGKQCVEAMYLLPFFNVCIKLRNTTEGKFVHEVDTVGVGNMLLTESFDSDREGCAKQTDLVCWVTHANELFEDRLKFR
jgi:hypothetical protein